MKKSMTLIVAAVLVLFGCQKTMDEPSFDNTNTDTDVEFRHYFGPSELSVPPCSTIHFTICLDDCFTDQYGSRYHKTAFVAAINKYNDLANVGIEIEIVNCNENPNIVISCYEWDDMYCDGNIIGGYANQFFDFEPQTNQLLINPLFSELVKCCPNYDLCSLEGTFIHEIGHVLGLDHTNDPAMGSTHINGTPFEDPNSIYNGHSLCERTCEFSVGDITALQLLFPKAEIERDDVCDNLFSINHPLASSITWISPASINGSTQTTVDLNSLSPGTYNLQAQVDIGACQVYATKTVQVKSFQCNLPSSPPSNLANVCFGTGPVCYNLGGASCFQNLQAISNNPKLVPQVNGTTICLESIHHTQGQANVSITYTTSCGQGNQTDWTINMNDSFFCP